MRKFTALAGIAIGAIGLATLSSGSAFAMGCLNSDLPVMSLTHQDMVPNQGFGYNKQAYDQAQASGNTCGTTQQSYNTDMDGLQSHPNQANNPENSGNPNSMSY